ncbi:hypothetical protein F5Y00DRAFT_273573 [Daldinia vernicosa]|uniref:uncharacterized protein n=1 Tax=Daldinia vernicosa TaxID=114800 RepID=UPI002007448A|nr:uncharacterized protein F5Y00DRAFT_273573 [Daldinia vernicosa]KAI0844815.1 hypothetical protein F5Y00DRAFT_273573 [Daldinia vernicosa]
MARSLYPARVRRVADLYNSRILFRAYTEKLKAKSSIKARQNQGPNLVKGLVDYMRVLEDRIDQLETGQESRASANKKGNSASQGSNVNNAVEVTVKFFNSRLYLEDDGSFIGVHSGTEEGTFMCDHDTQHLVRALYMKTRYDGENPTKRADSNAPDPDEIDILTFGISSEAVTTFLRKLLNVNTDSDSHLIRFNKPFRPLIQNIDRISAKLEELESRYGQVVIDNVESLQKAQKSSSEAPNTEVNREETKALPFAPHSTDEDSVSQQFDLPEALPHFQVFLKFLYEYLGKQIRLYKSLRQGMEQYVAFENLWMLFDPNETIYCPLREAGMETYRDIDGTTYTPVRRYTPQAYRVVATFGGMSITRNIPRPPRSKELNNSLYFTSSNKPPLEVETKLEAGDITEALTNTQILRKVRNSYTEFYVYCFYVDFDGTKYGIVRDIFVFKPYERCMEIRNLQAYPARYMARDRLHERGNSFLNVTNTAHLQYQGSIVGPTREEINSPVIIDTKLAFEGGPETKKAYIDVPKFPSPLPLILTISTKAESSYGIISFSTCSHKWCYSRFCMKDVYIESRIGQIYEIESEIKVSLEEYEGEKQRGEEGKKEFRKIMKEKDIIRLLPGAIPGFALRNRKWVLLDLRRLKPVEQNDEWDNLVLPEGHREMVQAMVETHTQELGFNKDVKIGMDLVPGKGRGCIILLHGVPGVGKTSTAGDIGYKPEDVERNMENHFKLAHRWGCVLLLDEADVFLAKRDQKDIQRNGLVSVFLRILEYYSGILFLTTNRVGAIDDAFRSRLHLTLYYPRLTKRQTRKIFKHNFQRIADLNDYREKNELSRFEYEDCEKKVMTWAAETWKTLRLNGRQIRNMFQTVLALAEFRAKRDSNRPTNVAVKVKYFKIVANASVQFNQYLLATHGADEDTVAKREYVRAVNFSPSSDIGFKGLDQPDTDSSSEADSDEDSGADSSSESSSESDKPKKKKKKASRGKKEKSSKGSTKKGKKSSEKTGKSGKKDKKKEKGNDDDDDDDDDSDTSD